VPILGVSSLDLAADSNVGGLFFVSKSANRSAVAKTDRLDGRCETGLHSLRATRICRNILAPLPGGRAKTQRVFERISLPDLDANRTGNAAEMQDRTDRGEVASYIPELARVDPQQFGLAVVSADGSVSAAGDCDTPFSIQSFPRSSP